MGKVRRELWTFTKAELSSLVASCVDFSLAIILTYTGLLPYGYANVVGVVSGGLTNYLINIRYVFTKTGRSGGSLALRYLCVWTGSMILNGGGTNLLTWLVGGKSYFIIVKSMMAVCVAFCFNYPLQRGWVFRKNNK